MTIRIMSKVQKQAHEGEGRELRGGVLLGPIGNKVQEEIEGKTSLMVEDTLKECGEKEVNNTEMVDGKGGNQANGSAWTIQGFDQVAPCFKSKNGEAPASAAKRRRSHRAKTVDGAGNRETRKRSANKNVSNPLACRAKAGMKQKPVISQPTCTPRRTSLIVSNVVLV